MGKVSGKLTVYFDEPFWVGVFVKIADGNLSVAKVTFDAEPKDYEVYEFILKHYYSLQFSPAVATVVKETIRNPKRVQRGCNKTITGHWNWYKIVAGFEITAGAEQTGT